MIAGGGYIYHELQLPFTSPLINILWKREEYCKFIEKPIYYFSQPLQILREANIRENLYPVGQIGTGNDKIRMEFVHSRSFQEAKELWERRKKRINHKRIFVKLGFDVHEQNASDYLKIFDKLSFPKICFYSGDTDIEDVVYLKKFEWICRQGNRMDSVSYNDYCRNMDYLFKDIDILKLLNGEKDYIREE